MASLRPLLGLLVLLMVPAAASILTPSPAITLELDAADAIDIELPAGESGECEQDCRAELLACSNACGTDQKCVDQCEREGAVCWKICDIKRAIGSRETSETREAAVPWPACMTFVSGPVDATLA